MRALVLALLLSGCRLVFTGGDDTVDVCDQPLPGIPAERLVNPSTLACQSFQQPSCDPACGPCPGGAIYVPPWGRCDSPCIGLAEGACMQDSTCRVARNYDDYYTNADPATPSDESGSFMGCFPLTNLPPGIVLDGCDDQPDGERCSLRSDCTALYRGMVGSCGFASLEACPGAEFVQCIPEAEAVAGTCGPAACAMPPPTCPAGTTPGVASGCWTGACIPSAFCI